MRTVEVKVFQYDELEDKAKEKARDWFRGCSAGDEWWDAVYKDAVHVAKILGIQIDTYPVQVRSGKNSVTIQKTSIMFSGFWSQGDGACFTGTYAYAKGSPKAIRKYAPQDEKLHAIADLLYEQQKECWYKIWCRVAHVGRYWHSRSTSFDFEGAKERQQEMTIENLLRDFMDWIYEQLLTEWEFRNSDETVAEDIRANEYEFTSDGVRYN